MDEETVLAEMSSKAGDAAVEAARKLLECWKRLDCEIVWRGGPVFGYCQPRSLGGQSGRVDRRFKAIILREVSDDARVALFLKTLGLGEAEAIVLAIEAMPTDC